MHAGKMKITFAAIIKKSVMYRRDDIYVDVDVTLVHNKIVSLVRFSVCIKE